MRPCSTPRRHRAGLPLAALEWARSRINVNAIAPTTTPSPMLAARLATPEVHAASVRGMPRGRVGHPEDVVGALLFLANPASDVGTGHPLVVDGGFTEGLLSRSGRNRQRVVQEQRATVAPENGA
jgi:hypothetical protein